MLSLAIVLVEKKNNLTPIREAKSILEKVVQLESDNILAWRLKGIAHSQLEEFVLADLAAAEENFRRRDFNSAIFFSKRVLKNSNQMSPESIRAKDILEIVK